MGQRHQFEFDGLFDWVLKREGKLDALNKNMAKNNNNTLTA
jgi:hypothetical protein